MSSCRGVVPHVSERASPAQALTRPPGELLALLFLDGAASVESSDQIRFASRRRTEGAWWHGRPLDHLSALTSFSRNKKCCISTNDLFSSPHPNHTRPLDPPPLLSYLPALMSGHAIKYEPKNYNLHRLQMPCSGCRIKWSQISFGKKKRRRFFEFHWGKVAVRERRVDLFHSVIRSHAHKQK